MRRPTAKATRLLASRSTHRHIALHARVSCNACVTLRWLEHFSYFIVPNIPASLHEVAECKAGMEDKCEG